MKRIFLSLFVILFIISSGAVFGHHDGEVPVFDEGERTERSVAENVPRGTNIGAPVTATDPDGDTLTYSLDQAIYRQRFDIDSATGQLKTKIALDYEAWNRVGLKVTASDGTNIRQITVIINVTNLNEPPTYSASETSREAPTSIGADENIGDPVTATDPDIALHYIDANPETETVDSLTYSISGTQAGLFNIDSATGQLKTTKAGTNYGINKGTYEVTVTASDSELEAVITVTVSFYDDSGEISEADVLPPISSEEAARIVSLLTMDRVIFNELLNASNDAHDWVELRNVSDTDIDLSGWQLIVTTSEGGKGIAFPDGTVLPAGGLLLFVNTDPNAPDTPLASAEDGAYQYLIDTGFTLPAQDFMMLLRSPSAWEDSVGNYFFGYPAPSTAPALLTDAAWYRARPDTIGTRSEAWVESEYQDGVGYDVGVPEAIAVGTPGYSQSSLQGDVNGDGVVNILDLVSVASHLGESGAPDVDVNNDGIINVQDLVLVANAFGTAVDAP